MRLPNVLVFSVYFSAVGLWRSVELGDKSFIAKVDGERIKVEQLAKNAITAVRNMEEKEEPETEHTEVWDVTKTRRFELWIRVFEFEQFERNNDFLGEHVNILMWGSTAQAAKGQSCFARCVAEMCASILLRAMKGYNTLTLTLDTHLTH